MFLVQSEKVVFIQRAYETDRKKLKHKVYLFNLFM
jgi:hypothetical protein